MSKFPPALHRIVRAWYVWQEVSLRTRGSFPGKEQRAPRGLETPEELFWGRRPPAMTGDGELAFVDDADVSYYLVIEDNQYYIDTKERGSRGRYWMFRRFEDAEKYLLFLMSQIARPGKYTDSPRYRWHRAGLDPRVSLGRPDPTNYPGRVDLTVDPEPTDRGWMGETDARAASHVITRSFEELDAELRKGIPPDWFSINIVTD